MAENDSKRYYWLRLKKDFFQQHQIKVLKSLPNGRLYALIYLELLAESTSHEGELRYSKMLPYDIITLSAVIDEDKDNVEKAIETLINLELIEMLDDGTIYMREIEKLIGSETGSAIRKRAYRERLTTIENVPQITEGTLSQNCPQEIRDKSIEIRDKNNKDYVPDRTSKKFIIPTIQEIENYCIENGYSTVSAEKFYSYYQDNDWTVKSKGKRKKMSNWKLALNNWVLNEIRYNETNDLRNRSREAYIKDVEMRQKAEEKKQEGGAWFD